MRGSHPERRAEATDLVGRVDAGVERGNVPSAQAAFTRSWRDAVPELPLRFSVMLVRVDRRAVSSLHARIRKARGRKAPPLKLERVDERTVRVITARGKRLVLGELPHADVKLLTELGRNSRHYRPQLLEISHDEEGQFRYIAVELVRPEMHRCPGCSRKHSGAHTYCADCRRRHQEDSEQSFEHTPVQIQEAIERITAETSGLGDDDLPV